MKKTQDETVTLTNCDREPIHQLGKIQDFGALLALDENWLVQHCSANAGELLQLEQAPQPGTPLARIFTDKAIALLQSRLENHLEDAEVQRMFGVDLLGADQHFDLAMHRSGPLTIIEVEPTDADSLQQHTSAIRPIMDRLKKARGIEELCRQAAQEMKALLGFDRVMVYRFHADESGEVVAEEREPHLERFLNLRYPKTDIPQQARRLYVRNLFRIISDVNGRQIPIEPPTRKGGEPIDLSLSTLRAVSPIHIEYLQNMGVRASLSISVVIDGKLWGLFACHHYSPRVLPYSLRTVAELFAQLFALQLELEQANAGRHLRERGRELHDRLMSRMAGGISLVENLATIDGIMREVISHDGSSVIIDGEYETRGEAPNEAEFRALLPQLNEMSTGQIICSDTIADLLPKAAAFADCAAGALIVPVSRRPRDYVILWRRELPQVVTWGGNPEKPVEYGPNGSRLTPRKSFEAWQESVRGRSAPWTPEELAIAENLRVTLLEVILRITDDAIRERSRAQQQQDLLIAELNHRVRNILTLIRSLVSQSRPEASDIEGFAELVSGRIRALAMAHDNITREQWAPASLHSLIEAEAEAYLSGKTDRVIVKGADVLVTPEAYTVLALVLHEMMTNSVKYGCLCDRSGRLEIEAKVDDSGELVISWRERGGPPVKAPTRQGFGSTIITRSIPFELHGEADIRYKLKGVEADFIIPGRFVRDVPEARGKDPAEIFAERKLGSANHAAKGARDNVLLVEDSIIIALDAEDILKGLGVRKVTVASSVEQAMAAIDKDPPDLALLDFNLGEESSEPVAERLAKAGIPFWFVTGYGDAVEILSDSKANGVMMKPYTSEDLKSLLEKAEAESGG
ncbi:light-regulated signal transduction histidine kinase (bacteriophytochrome) [Altererythrobacter atlanticus]|uniref:histidine kinase n=1 Tax=Croceibacterium atlanticum TaxID=1267766 RepID=A0A0F7KXA1_9SPHN|nr:HWE histidine kinase domain-containing protein [Croceibacterium atlanticum]AKH43862.1 Bacteriophytochrome [Croceibacterium atlanticum]MBB5733688.1 light-regulated signal transduction histidine kinase (bacteriophytochrome) [Croceibacterium atlanticum]